MNITFEVTPARPVLATPTVTDLLITMTPAAMPGPASLDLALVIDTSGSMGASRWRWPAPLPPDF